MVYIFNCEVDWMSTDNLPYENQKILDVSKRKVTPSKTTKIPRGLVVGYCTEAPVGSAILYYFFPKTKMIKIGI